VIRLKKKNLKILLSWKDSGQNFSKEDIKNTRFAFNCRKIVEDYFIKFR